MPGRRLVGLALALTVPPGVRAADPGMHFRANQAGYRPHDPKGVILFAAAPLPGRFEVRDDAGRVVVRGRLPPPLGAPWGRFCVHHELSLDALRKPGRYRVRVGGVEAGAVVVSPDAYRLLADSLLEFLRQQRCGYNPFLDAVCHALDGRTAYGPPARRHVRRRPRGLARRRRPAEVSPHGQQRHRAAAPRPSPGARSLPRRVRRAGPTGEQRAQRPARRGALGPRVDAAAPSLGGRAVPPGGRRPRPRRVEAPSPGRLRLRVGPGRLPRRLFRRRPPAGPGPVPERLYRRGEPRRAVRGGDGAGLARVEGRLAGASLRRAVSPGRDRGLRAGARA